METLLYLIAGVVLGYLFRNKRYTLTIADKGISYMVWLLLFFLGLAVGLNKQILANIYVLGWQALVLTIGASIGDFTITPSSMSYLLRTDFNCSSK